MKVLFFNDPPFHLAHGGMQTLTESLMREIARLGVEVEPQRWWDDKQKGDIIHYFVRPNIVNVRAGHEKGFKMVMTENLSQTASRTPFQLLAQRCVTRLTRRFFPSGLTVRMAWDVYQELDAMVYVVELEWNVAKYLFDADVRRGHIVFHGLDAEALTELAKPQEPGDYLISVATIHPRKNTLLLAQAAKLAGVPIVFLGKPYSQNDPYYLQFKQCVDGKFVRYPGFVSIEEKHSLLRGGRGFALLSLEESGCIAVLEAAAAGLPLLLPEVAWANKVYNHVPAARFVSLGNPQAVAPVLRSFYDQARRQSSPTFRVMSWGEVAQQYVQIYRQLMEGR